jgi:hypothetical protein
VIGADVNRKILLLERERDQLREVNSRLRDFLLARAKECESCGGTGCVTVKYYFADVENERVEDCGDCYDYRAVLAC